MTSSTSCVYPEHECENAGERGRCFVGPLSIYLANIQVTARLLYSLSHNENTAKYFSK